MELHSSCGAYISGLPHLSQFKFPDISLTNYHFSLTIYHIFQGKKNTLIVIKGNPTTRQGMQPFLVFRIQM